MSALPDWIAAEALRPAWVAIRRRFEAEGLRPQGRVAVASPTRQERHALGELLGRTITRERVTIDLGVLDRRLQERSGAGGLGHVLSRVFGEEPLDRPAARAARQHAREAPLLLAAERVQTPWADAWIADLRKTGLLTGRPEATAVIEHAAAVLHLVAGDSAARRDRTARSWSRVELGAQVAGDAHALDLDRLLHRVVLRGLAAAAGESMPEGAQAREELWARFGVEPDLLSRTCLVWGLAPGGGSAVARRLALAAEAGDPVHLTAWDLRRLDGEPLLGAGRVLVCENPRVIEAIAESRPSGWSAVCTSGEPNLVVASVLGSLARAAVQLCYHGDFDWPGIAIANRVLARFGAQPVQMAADDYLSGLRPDGPRLAGVPVEPSWDAELGATMRLHGRGVHEESVLIELVDGMLGGL